MESALPNLAERRPWGPGSLSRPPRRLIGFALRRLLVPLSEAEIHGALRWRDGFRERPRIQGSLHQVMLGVAIELPLCRLTQPPNLFGRVRHEPRS